MFFIRKLKKWLLFILNHWNELIWFAFLLECLQVCPFDNYITLTDPDIRKIWKRANISKTWRSRDRKTARPQNISFVAPSLKLWSVRLRLLFPDCLAFAIALHIYLVVDLFNILPLVEFIGIAELDKIWDIKTDNVSWVKGGGLSYGLLEIYIFRKG